MCHFEDEIELAFGFTKGEDVEDVGVIDICESACVFEEFIEDVFMFFGVEVKDLKGDMSFELSVVCFIDGSEWCAGEFFEQVEVAEPCGYGHFCVTFLAFDNAEEFFTGDWDAATTFRAGEGFVSVGLEV